jgi:phosphoglycolate phosphatase
MIDAVIFDKDGTLFDFRQSWGRFAGRMLADLARDEGHANDLAAAVGYLRETGGFTPDSVMIAGTSVEIAAAMHPLLPQSTLPALINRLNALSVTAPMYPAVALRPVLGALRARGLRLGLATNDTEEPARAHLAEAAVEDLFDFIAGCDSGHGAKPEPGMLLAFVRTFGLNPARVVMVGDSRHDLVAGRAAGMRVVGVLTGIAERPELEPHADIVLPDIAALSGWIDSLTAV